MKGVLDLSRATSVLCWLVTKIRFEGPVLAISFRIMSHTRYQVLPGKKEHINDAIYTSTRPNNSITLLRTLVSADPVAVEIVVGLRRYSNRTVSEVVLRGICLQYVGIVGRVTPTKAAQRLIQYIKQPGTRG